MAKDVSVTQSPGSGSATPFVKAALTVMDPQKHLSGLEWNFHERIMSLLLWLAVCGYGRLRVICGRRTLDEQRKLYGKGRTIGQCLCDGVAGTYAEPGVAQVTWTRPEASMHVRGQAIDVDWEAYGERVYGHVQSGCRRFGLRWGGDWDVRDYPHIELF
jgi:peptidoglycan L-alanyl-D-glutamate endopeptidase CwlK